MLICAGNFQFIYNLAGGENGRYRREGLAGVSASWGPKRKQEIRLTMSSTSAISDINELPLRKLLSLPLRDTELNLMHCRSVGRTRV
jgi:hypothetical protein